MKISYILFFILCMTLLSCFQCNEYYSIKESSQNLLSISLFGSTDNEEKMNFTFSYPDSLNKNKYYLQNAVFEFYDDGKKIEFQKVFAYLNYESIYYNNFKEIPFNLRNPKGSKEKRNEFLVIVDFEEKYKYLNNYKMYIVTTLINKIGKTKQYRNIYEVNRERKCSFRFTLH